MGRDTDYTQSEGRWGSLLERVGAGVCLILGGLGGYHLAAFVFLNFIPAEYRYLADVKYLALAAGVGALLGLLVAGRLTRGVARLLSGLVNALGRVPVQDVVVGALGLMAGLLIAILVTLPLPDRVPLVGDFLPFFTSLSLGYVAMAVAVRKKDELVRFLFPGRGGERDVRGKPGEPHPGRLGTGIPKILDTSVIIDGRIADICRTGFLEGPLVVPGFVVAELQRIADSQDTLRRNRGRRGLDILNRMRKEGKPAIQIIDTDGREGSVDDSLVQLARAMGGRVVTNDFNLNKVAELHGVEVLNVNELANAVKPVVLPGEEMTVHLIRDGKEHGQGVGYLDDGTMIVVDGGRKYIGETIGVLVTSVLQTAAGRLIFAKPKVAERAL